ncbi:MAG: response regulator transcription factor [Rhodoferax sp.]
MSVSLKIAVVEDHTNLRELFVDYLNAQAHDAAGFFSADELDEHLVDKSVDLLILDLNLPGEDGFSIARRMCQAHPDLHIIMITARTALADRIRGYASGADLYLSKPVAPAELGAAVSSVARRVQAAANRQSALVLDTARLTLRGDKAEVTLSKSDELMLKGLAEAPGRKLDYWRLLELIDLEPDDKGKSALEVRISRLKKKMVEAGAPDPAIKSLWKEGYQLCLPVQIQS